MTKPPAELPTSPETILVAEDEEVVRRLLVELLRRAGYEVLAAANGALALELARGHETPINLLITDVAMPGMHGTELARKLGALQPGLRILLISGYSNPAQVAEIQSQPGVAYLRKPFVPKALLSQVRSLLDSLN
ncbi:MAG: response regulator [Terriglobales bacterium]